MTEIRKRLEEIKAANSELRFINGPASLIPLDEYTWLITALESSLKREEIAREAMSDFSDMYRIDFHRNVCGQTMGCHCSENSLDEALTKMKEVEMDGI